MITKEQIQAKIVEAIRKSGKTQIQIAKELGLSIQTINRYAQGYRLPPVDTFIKLCIALNLDANYILCLT
ncbi:MAG: helix-turn-helix domain-containing protein [Clostridia bacterium]|nr:helix-turn-helix domain-containing protein [Clostridia bacterium]